MARRRRRAADLLTSTLEAQAAMMVTLGQRVPGLLAGTLSPAEQVRMVSEKAEAFAESAGAVQRTAVRMMTRPVTPASMAGTWLALAAAASRPYHRRVKANATRLSKSRRKTSG